MTVNKRSGENLGQYVVFSVGPADIAEEMALNGHHIVVGVGDKFQSNNGDGAAVDDVRADLGANK